MTYRVEITEEQLHIILRAVEMMMRTGIGQTDMLADWMTTRGHAINYSEEDKRDFYRHIYTKDVVKCELQGIMAACTDRSIDKSMTVKELNTIYEAIGHTIWLQQAEERRNYMDVRAQTPMQWGEEPVPKIERVGK